jgi:N-acetylmuramoyl-L-alanine amidase
MRGLPVADGTGVAVTTSVTSDTVWAAVSDGSIDAVVKTPQTGDVLEIYAQCRGKRFEHSVNPNPDAGVATRAYRVRDAVTGLPVEDALVTIDGSGMTSASRTGSFVYDYRPGMAAADSAGGFLSVSAPGYVPVVLSPSLPADTIVMTPWFGGALTGRRFVVDPEGGRASVSGIGPLGLSGAHANLQVARYLAGYLRAAGARVRLTRTNDEVRTPEDIARLTNRFVADRYIEIRHRSAPADSPLVVTAYHFPGSIAGARMAADVSASMSERLGVPSRGPFDTVTYPLQQTACPAIVVSAPSIGVLEEELRLAESWYQREQAYAIFLGVLNHYGVEGSARLVVRMGTPEPDDSVGATTSEGVATREQPDLSGWRITLEDTWSLVTGPDGMVRFDKIPPGEYRVSAVKSGQLFGHHVGLETGARAVVRFEPAGPADQP